MNLPLEKSQYILSVVLTKSFEKFVLNLGSWLIFQNIEITITILNYQVSINKCVSFCVSINAKQVYL